MQLDSEKAAREIYSAAVGQSISYDYEQKLVDVRIHKDFFNNTPLENFGELELCQFNGEISLDYLDVLFAPNNNATIFK